MVIDSSAIIALLFREPEADLIEACRESAERRLISAVTRAERALVVEGRKGETGRRDLEELLRLVNPDIVAVTAHHADLAIDAFRRFGQGRHRAALNIGDCFSYALARASDQPLMFKGDNIFLTDVPVAPQNSRL